MNIPFYSEISALVKEGGFEAYLVGGCVRDVILNRDVNDLDMICMSHDYRSFAHSVRILLPSAWVEFKDNVRLVCPNLEIDVSKPRGETLLEDLSKRDFTINSLAMDFDGNIFGDRSDIDAKIIRHVSETTFTDDPLRMLRTFRFVAQLGFQVCPETIDKIHTEKHLIKESPKERILQELSKLFKGPFADTALSLMNDCGLYPLIFENHEYGCLSLESCRTGKGFEFFLSALIYEDSDIKSLLSSLSLSNASSRKAVRTSEAADKLYNNFKNFDIFELRKLIYAYSDELEDALELFSAAAKCDTLELADIDAYVHDVMIQTGQVDFETPMRLNGGFLMNLGIKAGRMMGEIIDEVRPLLASGEIHGLEAAEKYIKEKWGSG